MSLNTENTSKSQKKGPNPEDIKNLFNSISKTYDKTNDIITMGFVRPWRKKMISHSGAKSGDKVLDCATGTGDLAFEFKKVVGPTGTVLGTDFCKGMLEEGPKKAKLLNLDVQFEFADATCLQYEDNSFDITSIGYGIRNVSDPVKALCEMARVTKPGGTVIVLETGDTKNPVLQPFINIYFKHIVPRLGGWTSGNRPAYEYLNKSSNHFPSKNDFLNLMNQTGQLQGLSCKTLMGGASFIYKGTVN